MVKKKAIFLVLGIMFCLTLMARTTFAEEKPCISKINLSDVQGIDPALVMQQLDFKVGDQFDPEKINLSELRLKKLGIFKDGSVEIFTSPDEANGIVVDIAGEPIKQGMSFGLGLTKGYDDLVGFKPEKEAEAAQDLSTLAVNLDYNNVADSGANIAAKYGFLGDRWWNIGFKSPTLLGSPTSVTGSWGRKEIDWELARGKYAGSTYHASTREISFGLQHVFSAKGIGNLVLGYRDNHIDNANSMHDISGENREFVFAAPSYVWSSFDDPEDPRTGTIISTGAILGKDTEKDGKGFTRADFDIQHFFPVNGSHELYVRSLFGIATKDTPLTMQKFLGGKEILRAHMAEIYGPNYLAGTIEYRRNFTLGLQAFSFVDVGRTWDSGEKVEFKDFVADVGVGGRFKIPNWIEFSCTYAHNFDEKQGRFWFGASKSF